MGRIFSEVKIGRILIITVLIMGLVMYLPNLPVHIPGVQIPKLLNSYASGPTVLQSNGAQGAASTNAVAFSSNVHSGNILAAAMGCISTGCSFPGTPVTDSQGNTWTQIRTDACSAGVVCNSGLFYTTASSTGSNTVTCHFGGATLNDCNIFELSGASTIGLTQSGQGTDSTGCGCTVPSYTTAGVTIEAAVTNLLAFGSWTCTSGFTVAHYTTDTQIGANACFSSTQTGASTLPMTEGSSQAPWAESAASFPAPPSPNLVQKKTGQIMNGANSGTLAYTSNVVSGDTLIALQLDILPINSCASNCGATANTPTDTLGDTFSSIPVATGSTCVVAPQGCFSNVVFWVATASSNASDTVSFSVTNANAAIMLSYGEIFEFNNVPSPLKKALTGNTGGSGVACGCMLATNLAITSGDFVIGGAADDGFASGGCAGAGSFLATPNATGWVTDQNTAAGSCQYFGSGHILNSAASPNQYEWIDAMTTHRNFAVGVLDLGLGNASSPTFAQQPLKCTMFKVGPQATLTLGGSSNPIPATLPCDGSQHLVNVTSSAGAILDQSVSNSSNSRVTNQIGVIVNSIIIGDTLVIGAVGDLSSGTTSTITIVAPPGFYCPTNVANPGTSSSAAISIATCNKVGRGGTATWLASWTTNSCGLGSGCGYMSIYVYEFTGSSYSFLFSNGNNNATSTSTPHTNTVTLAGTDYLLAFDGVHSNKITQSAGSGFSLGTCYTTAITSTIFSCAETNSAGTTSTTFPFTLNASASWSDEGVAITGGITTMTLTEPADGGTTRDRFTGGVTTITLAPCSSGTCSSYNFTNYFQILKPLSYSVASGTPSGGTFPTITYSNVGGSVTTALSISSANIWIDNFTNAVPLNPWFSNLQDFFPNPDFNINNVTSQTIVYSSGGTTNCAGTNTTALFQNGTCFIPAIFWTFANVITPAGTYTLIFVFPESLAIFLKSRDMLLTFSVASLLAGTVNAATRSLPLYAVAIIVLIGGAMLAATFLRLVRKETVG